MSRGMPTLSSLVSASNSICSWLSIKHVSSPAGSTYKLTPGSLGHTCRKSRSTDTTLLEDPRLVIHVNTRGLLLINTAHAYTASSPLASAGLLPVTGSGIQSPETSAEPNVHFVLFPNKSGHFPFLQIKFCIFIF